MLFADASFAVHAVLEVEFRLDHVSEAHVEPALVAQLLQAKLLSAEQESQRASQASERRSLVGSGDRSERIRTYNFPQGRITDHRINLTLYKLDEVVSGDLDPLILPLRQEHQADLLAAMAEE